MMVMRGATGPGDTGGMGGIKDTCNTGSSWISFGMYLTAILLLFCGLFYGTQARAFADTMSVKYRDAVLTPGRIDQLHGGAVQGVMQEQEIPYITGWRSTPDTAVTNPLLKQIRKLELIELHGDMTAVYPAALIYGSFVEKEDRNGCVLSSAAAEELFQSRETVGCMVTLGKTEYTVRGVFSSKEAVMMIQTGEDEAAAFTCLELKYPDGSYPASKTKEMLTAIGLPAYVSFTEGNLYAGIARLFLGLPLLILLIRISQSAARRIKRVDQPLLRRLLAAAAAVLFLLFLAGLIKYSVAFSQDYIPSGISDFSFWPQLYSAVHSDYQAVLAYRSGFADDMLLHSMRCTIVSFTACAALLAVTGVRYRKDRAARQIISK